MCFRISSSNISKTDVVSYCYLAYAGPFWFIGLLSGSRNRTLRFHLNQGIVLFCFEIVAMILSRIISGLLELVISGSAGVWISRALWLAVLAWAMWFSILGMLNVARNRKTQLPVIGSVKLLRQT